MRGVIARVGAAVILFAALTGCGDARPALPADLGALNFDTLFSIGVADGQAWETFQGVWDIEVDPDGLIAVLDLGGPAVHVYGPEGQWIGSVDEGGLGEGQLDRPSGIAWSGAGELLIWDPGSSWISRYDVSRTDVAFRDRWRAFAFGETGFCAREERTWLSYFQGGTIVHELAPDGPVRSFGAAPAVVGVDSLGAELQEIAIEELTPSALLCTESGVLDVSFVQSLVRLHDSEGTERWSRQFDDFRPIVVFTPDGIGLGRAFDAGAGSHLLRSVTAWGDGVALVQHELRTREIPEAGDEEVIESRLIRLDDGTEVSRSRDIPLALAAVDSRFYLVGQTPFARITVVEVR